MNNCRECNYPTDGEVCELCERQAGVLYDLAWSYDMSGARIKEAMLSAIEFLKEAGRERGTVDAMSRLFLILDSLASTSKSLPSDLGSYLWEQSRNQNAIMGKNR